jgi:hypothetical protein
LFQAAIPNRSKTKLDRHIIGAGQVQRMGDNSQLLSSYQELCGHPTTGRVVWVRAIRGAYLHPQTIDTGGEHSINFAIINIPNDW